LCTFQVALMTIFLLIFLIALLIYSFLIDYYRRSWNRISNAEIHDVDDVRISVIIAVRNEEINLPDLIAHLRRQQYPKTLFEVVLIDDHSTDDTYQLLQSLKNDDISLKILQLPDGVTSKKRAIEAGIKAAIGELIITTDADCRMNDTWISSFASFFKQTGAQFIAAPVKMEGHFSLLHILQSLDFLAMQAITAASVNNRFHTMCNGANLAYTKSAFIEVNGFEGIDEIPSGDDMLLMHKIYIRYPDKVLYMKNADAIVTTVPESTWKNFLQQRIRWASKAVHYKDKRIIYVLALIYLVNVCYLVLAVAAIIKIYWLSFLSLLLLAKILIEFPFVNATAIFFHQQKLMKYFPLLQPIHIAYIVVSGWLGRFGSYEWKSRIIKNKGRGNLVKQ
jgi:cellulose synthase/poly-beta-1,6-N-acetylglucosamine synthase-like glycosyltransferase